MLILLLYNSWDKGGWGNSLPQTTSNLQEVYSLLHMPFGGCCAFAAQSKVGIIRMVWMAHHKNIERVSILSNSKWGGIIVLLFSQ